MGMANRRREGDREEDPLLRSAKPGEPPEPAHPRDTNAKSWRERYPGWETFEGRPNDPRFATRQNPYQDPRWYTNLNPSFAVPRRPGPLLWILGVALGVLLLLLLVLLMNYHFQRPSPRSPENPRGALPEGQTPATMYARSRGGRQLGGQRHVLIELVVSPSEREHSPQVI
jgi:hypothetical protein